MVPQSYVAEKNKRLKEECYKHTVIRFSYANETIIQAQFISREPGYSYNYNSVCQISHDNDFWIINNEIIFILSVSVIISYSKVNIG